MRLSLTRPVFPVVSVLTLVRRMMMSAMIMNMIIDVAIMIMIINVINMMTIIASIYQSIVEID